MSPSKTQIFNKAMSSTIAPFLQETGFTGEYPDFIRKQDRRIDAVSFVSNRAGDLGVEIAQVLPDGSVPGQPGSMDIIKASWVHDFLKHRIGSVPWGHDGFLSTGWLDTRGKSPDFLPQLAQQITEGLRREAYPWFDAEPVLQYQDIIRSAVPVLKEWGFTGAFPDFQRHFQDRIDLLGFFLDKRGLFAIEVAQVRPDGSEGIGRPPYGYCKPEHMRFYNVSPRLRKRLKDQWVTALFSRKQTPAERALDMIRREAEPWFKSCPVLR